MKNEFYLLGMISFSCLFLGMLITFILEELGASTRCIRLIFSAMVIIWLGADYVWNTKIKNKK